MKLALLLALGAASLAQPAWAQAPRTAAPQDLGNQPSERPAIAPIPTGLPRDAWLAECARRLNTVKGADPTLTPGACLHWWAYYQGGGAPDPSYGYVVPITVTETVEDCPKPAPVRPIPRKRVIRYHDKRVRV